MYSFALAQTHVEVKTDSVKVVNGELIIENATKSVKGYLYNTGNGVTTFKSGTIKLDDTTYLIGADTLHLSKGQSYGSDSLLTGIFYVAKEYIGVARTLVNGTGLSSISSSNSSYIQQLNLAKMGSYAHPFPDPYSARNAALDLVAAGNITSATIVVLDNQQWTVGSNDSTKNGNAAGVSTTNTPADICFSSTNASTSIASLAANNVQSRFGTNAGFIYINKTYNIPLVYVVDPTDILFESRIDGKGYFKQLYGQANGFVASMVKIDNARATMSLEADELWLQQWQGFYLVNHKNISIKTKKMIAADGNLFSLQGSNREGDGKPSSIYVDVDVMYFGNSTFPVSGPIDYWYMIYHGDASANWGSTRHKLININIGTLNFIASNSYAFFRMDGNNNPIPAANFNNITCNVNVNTFRATYSGAGSGDQGLGSGIVGFVGTNGIVSQCHWNFNINHYEGALKLLGPIGLNQNASNANHTVMLNVGDAFRKGYSGGTNGLIYLGSAFSGSGKKPIVYINMLRAEDGVSECISMGSNVNNSYYVISGTYISSSPSSTVEGISNGVDYNTVLFRNCTFANKTTGASVITTSTPPATLYMSNVIVSDALPSNITVVGESPRTMAILKTIP